MPIMIFLISSGLAALLAPAIIAWYRHQGWVDDPNTNLHAKKTHRFAVPRGGGLVIFGAVLAVTLATLPLTTHVVAILAGAALLTLVGVADDIYDLHPLFRLGTGLLAALIVVGSGIGIAYVTNPFGPGVIHLDQPQLTWWWAGQAHQIWLIADLFAVLFIVWNMNIVNWSKGVDGQMPGFVAIAATMIGLLSTRFIDDPTNFNTPVLAAIVAGAFAGLLIWNFYPQKIMPGYGAGSLAGYFLSVLAIISGAKLATTLMVLAIPTADAVFAIARRILAGKKPWWGDRGHMHHKLMDVLGWGKRRIAIFYWLTSLSLGVLSLYLNTWGKILAVGTVFGLVFGFMTWAKWITARRA